jgi:hypothetical protein
MKNPTGNKLDKLIFGMFDQMIEGVDQYNHSGSLWLIFTNERQWVVEYTVGGTLWYNYKLFKNEMELVGMDCVENKEYVTRWFEDRFLNKPKVDETWDNSFVQDYQVENIIQNRVKDASTGKLLIQRQVEDTIQNGVKRTTDFGTIDSLKIEDTIQNGVKETTWMEKRAFGKVERIIENGVKHTKTLNLKIEESVEDVIENGVKESREVFIDMISHVEYTIENGEKIELK